MTPIEDQLNEGWQEAIRLRGEFEALERVFWQEREMRKQVIEENAALRARAEALAKQCDDYAHDHLNIAQAEMLAGAAVAGKAAAEHRVAALRAQLEKMAEALEESEVLLCGITTIPEVTQYVRERCLSALPVAREALAAYRSQVQTREVMPTDGANQTASESIPVTEAGATAEQSVAPASCTKCQGSSEIKRCLRAGASTTPTIIICRDASEICDACNGSGLAPASSTVGPTLERDAAKEDLLVSLYDKAIEQRDTLRAALEKALMLLEHVRGSEIPGREPKEKIVAELRKALSK